MRNDKLSALKIQNFLKIQLKFNFSRINIYKINDILQYHNIFIFVIKSKIKIQL